jgi:hypothetical protein
VFPHLCYGLDMVLRNVQDDGMFHMGSAVGMSGTQS